MGLTLCISWEYQVALFGKMPSKYKKGKMDPKMTLRASGHFIPTGPMDFGPPE